MTKAYVNMFALLLWTFHLLSLGLAQVMITNGPNDTTVCSGGIVNISCGFSGADPSTAFPDWIIVRRSDSGSVISTMTISGDDIVLNNVDGLQWVPDLTTGGNNAPNSYLIVGPVDESDDQSSYQCRVTTIGGSDVSTIGTLTVAGGPPAPVTSLDVSEVCVNGFIVSWDPVTSHPVCGSVSYNVAILPSDEIMMNEINDTFYSVTKSPTQFGRLTNFANLNVTVIGTNLGGSGVPIAIEVKVPGLSQAVPSSVRNLTNTITTKDATDVQWGAANVSFCGDILKYYVTISYGNGTLVEGGSTAQKNYTFYDLMDNTYYVIVVLASNAAGNGTPTSLVVKTLGPQGDNDDDSVAAIVGGVVGTFIITLVLSTLISVIITRMYYKYWYDLKRKPNNGNSESVQHDTFKMDTNPSYATTVMATDTIKMDTNPAYTVAK